MLPIAIAEKEKWRSLFICDISPSVRVTGVKFRKEFARLLSVIERVDPTVADLIAQDVRYIANTFPLNELTSYNRSSRIFLVHWRRIMHDAASPAEAYGFTAEMLINAVVVALRIQQSQYDAITDRIRELDAKLLRTRVVEEMKFACDERGG